MCITNVCTHEAPWVLTIVDNEYLVFTPRHNPTAHVYSLWNGAGVVFDHRQRTRELQSAIVFVFIHHSDALLDLVRRALVDAVLVVLRRPMDASTMMGNRFPAGLVLAALTCSGTF